MNRLGRRDKIDERFRQLRDADGLLRDNRELRIKLRQLDTENSHLRERIINTIHQKSKVVSMDLTLVSSNQQQIASEK
ncbi:unnamed protein product [Rhizophagus irregularis]|nr:unnamed protein product [Rhizophagus irregularis]